MQGEKVVVSTCLKIRIPMKSELFKAWFKIPLLQMCIWCSNFEVVWGNVLYTILNLKEKRKKNIMKDWFFTKNWVTYCETLIQTHVLYVVFNHNAVKWPLVVSSSYCAVRMLAREEFFRLALMLLNKEHAWTCGKKKKSRVNWCRTPRFSREKTNFLN